MSERKESCKACQYFGIDGRTLPHIDEDAYMRGNCIKRSPDRATSGSGTLSVNDQWPTTDVDRWCGDFEAVTDRE